jgi:hypothetical protein
LKHSFIYYLLLIETIERSLDHCAPDTMMIVYIRFSLSFSLSPSITYDTKSNLLCLKRILLLGMEVYIGLLGIEIIPNGIQEMVITVRFLPNDESHQQFGHSQEQATKQIAKAL